MATIGILEERYANHEIERAVIEAAGHRMLDIPPDRDDWTEWMKDADAVLVNLTGIGAQELDRLPKCRVISRYGVGCDAIDVDGAARRGVAVLNQPAVTVAEVTEHALALWLACMRQVVPRDAAVRRGEWNVETAAPTRRIQGAVVGVVGYGRIGRAVASRMGAFLPSKVMVYDPYASETEIREAGCVPASFAEIVEEASTITLHCALTEETAEIINADSIARMKRGVCIINTSRGGLVNLDDVYAALENGHLHSVGFDVFATEPPDNHPILRHPGAVLTDHCSWYSVQSQIELQRATAESAVRYLAGETGELSIVNEQQLAQIR